MAKTENEYKIILTTMKTVCTRLSNHNVGGDIAKKHQKNAIEHMEQAIEEVKESILADM
jgi:hypothetical protein